MRTSKQSLLVPEGLFQACDKGNGVPPARGECEICSPSTRERREGSSHSQAKKQTHQDARCAREGALAAGPHRGG